MKRAFFLLVLLASFSSTLNACSDDDTDEPGAHGDHDHDDAGG